jgi:hypothetical protein
VDSREQLAVANEKIAQLESHLALLKRGFDPPPLTNPISEEQHRAMLFAAERSAARRSSWVLLSILVAVLSWFVFFVVLFAPFTGIHPTVGPISSYAKLHGPPVHPVAAKSP